MHRRAGFYIIALLLVFSPVYAVLAQATPGADETVSLVDAIMHVLGVSAFAGIPATIVITSILKRWSVLASTPAPLINGVVALLIAASVGIAEYFGFSAQWRAALDTFGQIVPPLLNFLVTFFGGAVVFTEVVKPLRLPFIGYSRTP